jgi:hemoglobin-like flavoprotein
MELNIKLIQETFELVKPHAEEFASRFYANLFQDYPDAQELFRNSKMDKQKRLLLASLVQVVDNLENPEFLAEYLGKMGERHLAYGTADEHFEWVGLSLLKTFKDIVGKDWTHEFNHQWALAFDVVAALMRDGLARARAKVVPLRLAEAEKDEAPRLAGIILPSDVKDYLDQLAKKYVQQAAQDYFEQATQREFKEVMGHRVQEILKKVS